MSALSTLPNNQTTVPRTRRERWAAAVASLVVVVHLFAGIFVFGWYYWIVPRWKYQLEQYGYQLTPEAVLLIQCSDIVILLGVLLVVLALPVLVIDFLWAHWMVRQSGMRITLAIATFIALIPLASFASGQYIMQRQMALLEQQGLTIAPEAEAE